MKERVCCVYDTDERYAVKLTEAMNRSDETNNIHKIKASQ